MEVGGKGKKKTKHDWDEESSRLEEGEGRYDIYLDEGLGDSLFLRDRWNMLYSGRRVTSS